MRKLSAGLRGARAGIGAAALACALGCGEPADVREGIAGRSGTLAAPETGARRERAPEFALIDQAGRPFSSASLRGRVVLVDFIFTHCGGPCPILTGIHVALQRRLPPALRERTAFVSISVDPERDTPEQLLAYARARGADLAGWSFLTGTAAQIESVARGFGVGSSREPGGEIAHTTATFLLDPAFRIARRFTGLEHGPEELELALRELL